MWYIVEGVLVVIVFGYLFALYSKHLWYTKDLIQTNIKSIRPCLETPTKTSDNVPAVRKRSGTESHKAERGPKARKDSDAVSQPSGTGNTFHEDNSFRQFQKICSKISNNPSYLKKTEIVAKFFKHGTGTEFKVGTYAVWLSITCFDSSKATLLFPLIPLSFLFSSSTISLTRSILINTFLFLSISSSFYLRWNLFRCLFSCLLKPFFFSGRFVSLG